MAKERETIASIKKAASEAFATNKEIVDQALISKDRAVREAEAALKELQQQREANDLLERKASHYQAESTRLAGELNKANGRLAGYADAVDSFTNRTQTKSDFGAPRRHIVSGNIGMGAGVMAVERHDESYAGVREFYSGKTECSNAASNRFYR